MTKNKDVQEISQAAIDITNFLDADYIEELEYELSREDAVAESTFLVDIDEELQQQLDNDMVSPEWIRDHAPWKQQPNEDNDDYFMFTFFCGLPVNKWDVKDAYLAYLRATDDEYNKNDENIFILTAENNKWLIRRSSYIAYKDWVNRKREEIEQLNAIANFRNNQASILNRISRAASHLVEKIAVKIERIDPDEISVRDIPTFVNSVSNILNIAADAEARILAVSELLEMFENEMSADRLREHVYGTNLGIDNKPNKRIENKGTKKAKKGPKNA